MMTTQELMSKILEYVAIGVRLPEGMAPYTDGISKWKMGVEAGQRSMRSFIGFLLDNYADAVAESPDAADLTPIENPVPHDYSNFSSVIEQSDEAIHRLLVRVDNTGDDEVDFAAIGMGTLKTMNDLNDVLNRYAENKYR